MQLFLYSLKKIVSNDILVYWTFVDPRFKYDENCLEEGELTSAEEKILNFSY